MSTDDNFKMLREGTFSQRQIALRRIGFRLAVAKRNINYSSDIVLFQHGTQYRLLHKQPSGRTQDALAEAIRLRSAVFDEACTIVASPHLYPPELRMVAVQVLGECLDSQVVPLLISTTRDASFSVMHESFLALFRIGTLGAHACIRAAYKRKTIDFETADLLKSCWGEFSMLKWRLWQLITRSTEKAWDWYDEAIRLYELGDLTAAIKCMRRATYHWPYDRVFWLTLGEWLNENGQEGLGHLRFGVSLCPFEPQTIQRLAQVLRNSGEPEDLEMARFWYSQIIELKPGPNSLSEALIGKADVLVKLNIPSEAAQNYREALSVFDSDPFVDEYRLRIKYDVADKLRTLEVSPNPRAALRPPLRPVSPRVSIPPAFGSAMRQAQQLQIQSQDDVKAIAPLIQVYEDILQRLPPDENPDFRSAVQNFLCMIYPTSPSGDHIANVMKAIEYGQQALGVRTPATSPLNYAMTQDHLGKAYLSLPNNASGDTTEQAITCFREALRFWDPQNTPFEYQTTQVNLGVAYQFLRTDDLGRNLQDAIECYEEALRIILSARVNILEYAKVQANQGQAYANLPIGNRTENLTKAIAFYREALRGYTAKTTPHSYAALQTNLGNAYSHLALWDRQYVEQAVECYREALKYFTPEADLSAFRLVNCQLGDLYFAQVDWVSAQAAYAAAIDADEREYKAQVLRISKGRSLHDIQNLYSRAAFSFARNNDLLAAVETIERGRTRLLVEKLERNRIDLESLPSAGHADLYQRYLVICDEISQFESNELFREGLLPDVDFASQLYDIRSKLDAIVAEIQRVPNFGHIFSVPTFESIQRTVTAEGNIGTYILATTKGGLALIVSEDSVKEVSLDFTEDTVSAWLFKQDGDQTSGGYLTALMGNTLLEPHLDALLPFLGQQVIKPLANALRSLNASDVTLIPCGRLALFPLHAAEYLVDGQTRRFMDEFTVTYTPSARALDSCQKTLTTVANKSSTLLGVGNPLPLSGGASPLNYAQSEVEEIAPLFDQASTLLYEQQATREALDGQLGQTTYLHLSCHGMFDAQDPLESGVILSNGEMLTVRDLIGGQRLRGTRLVVLSACQTAITDFNDLPEEAIGLPGGFVQAGVPGVVGTLWPVNDLSTMLLMVKFYEAHLKDGLAPAAALRKAQLWLRDVTNAELSELFARYKLTATDRPTSTRMAYEMASEKFREHTLRDPNERPYAHPYYWAPFVFYGV